MNVDLKKALKKVQENFPDATLEGNFVEIRRSEFSQADIYELNQLGLIRHFDEENQTGFGLSPWVFRSGKQVKVVVFIKQHDYTYITSREEYEQFEDTEGENDDLEEKTDKNLNVISGFMDHCRENGISIPEEIFESYFDA